MSNKHFEFLEWKIGELPFGEFLNSEKLFEVKLPLPTLVIRNELSMMHTILKY